MCQWFCPHTLGRYPYPNHHKYRNSFRNCWWRVRGIFQCYAILECVVINTLFRPVTNQLMGTSKFVNECLQSCFASTRNIGGTYCCWKSWHQSVGSLSNYLYTSFIHPRCRISSQQIKHLVFVMPFFQNFDGTFDPDCHPKKIKLPPIRSHQKHWMKRR